MSIKRKCKVVMLLTNEKAAAPIFKSNNYLYIGYGEKLEYKNKDNSYQHLYITSDEDIKEDDWYIDDCNQIRRSVTSDKEYWSVREDYKKIIATTDTLLISINEHYFDVNKSRKSAVLEQKTLPQIPQQFIELYCQKYNEGNYITEVIVEYEIICGRCYSNTDECWSAKECSRNTDFPDIVKLKVNSDNTINIKPIKDSRSREEVKQLIEKAFTGIGTKNNCIEAVVQSNGLLTIYKLDKWIEENL